ncbi:MAG: Glu/Leu/Phe/Val dehydrogenase [Gammaproteobacteria bacterium]|nr:MAG: Glu/Leu/Phe/Val dehydrogenase [Gammaproteobacteria bacterium]
MSIGEAFIHADDLGPHKIIHVTEPSAGLKGTLVIDNIAIGPAIGGLRMAPDVSTRECFRLARAMTLKNAAAGLRHGGGKSVIYGDPRMQRERKEHCIRAFAAALRHEPGYIFGPDMGTDETCMAWVRDEVGRASGLPAVLGGIPLDELGATGWGLAHAAAVAAEFIGIELQGARVVVQGFGAVGMHAARFLRDQGTVLVGAADSRGSVYDGDGLDVDALMEIKRQGGCVADADTGKAGTPDAVVAMDCEIWIPAARPDVLREENVDDLSARIVLQGANIPCTDGAEASLHGRGVLCLPDFIANAGGVICAACEYAGMEADAAFKVIETRIRANTAEILERSAKYGQLPREAAMTMARHRVEDAMKTRRWSLF